MMGNREVGRYELEPLESTLGEGFLGCSFLIVALLSIVVVLLPVVVVLLPVVVVLLPVVVVLLPVVVLLVVPLVTNFLLSVVKLLSKFVLCL